MDIYEYLELDHKKVAKLFELFASAKTVKNKLEIFTMLDQEIRVNADSESQTFYKALEQHQKSEALAIHGEDEHNQIKRKLAEIACILSVNNMMEKKVQELKELVEHHVSEEEGEIFAAAKKILSDDDALTLKMQMHDIKGKMLLSEKIAERLEVEQLLE